MDILYCFMLSDDGKSIIRYEIKDIEFRRRSAKYTQDSRYDCWRFKSPTSGCQTAIYRSKLDRYVSCRMYTFNSDIGHAKDVILHSLEQRFKTAEQSYFKAKYEYFKLKESNNG